MQQDTFWLSGQDIRGNLDDDQTIKVGKLIPVLWSVEDVEQLFEESLSRIERNIVARIENMSTYEKQKFKVDKNRLFPKFDFELHPQFQKTMKSGLKMTDGTLLENFIKKNLKVFEEAHNEMMDTLRVEFINEQNSDVTSCIVS
jgi:hypothetical protein